PIGLLIEKETAGGNRIVGNRFGLAPEKAAVMFTEDIHILLRGVKDTEIGGEAEGEGNAFGPVGRQPIVYEHTSEKDHLVLNNTFSKSARPAATPNADTSARVAAGPPEIGGSGITVFVTNTADSGAGSLRQAILDINS